MSGYVAAATLAATVIAGAATVVGQVKQAEGAATTARFQSEMARRNAQIAEWNAEQTTKQGDIEADKQSLKTAQIMGMQRAGLATQGGDVNVGTNVDILGDTARAGKFDEDTIRSNAALRAYGFRIQGAGATAEAGLFDMAAANATANLPFAVAGTIAGTASSTGSKFMEYKRQLGGKDWFS